MKRHGFVLLILALLCPIALGAEPLSLLGDRFRVEASWRTAAGQTGVGTPVSLTSETGYFWFFSPTNVEVVVKVLDACANPSGRFWVFAGGLTDVEVTLEVTDNATGEKKTYRNPQGTPYQPIQDTNAFATCGVERCGQGSADELAATPRVESPAFEFLARILDGGLTASPAVFQRVLADVAAIRQHEPALAGVSFHPYVSPHTLFLTFHDVTYPSVVAGSYRAWDCLNAWYGISPGWTSNNQVELTSDKVLDMRRVALDYLSLSGVTAATAQTFDPFPVTNPPGPASFCGRAQGSLYHYYVRFGASGSGRYSYYTTLPGATPVFVDSVPLVFPGPPGWIQDANTCFQEHVQPFGPPVLLDR
jgi:hypothetical protein